MERGFLRTFWKLAKHPPLTEGRPNGPPRRDLDLESRSPLHVKDDAAAALWAEEPLPLPVIAQPEGAAADRPLRHEHRTARTERDLPALHRVAHGLLLGRREARRLGHKRTTTLPNCAPLFKYIMASLSSSNAKTLSVTGTILCCDIARNMASMPSRCPTVTP